jgi:endonuclease/exonuclease/phosphatase family metal-dependent hydrolase
VAGRLTAASHDRRLAGRLTAASRGRAVAGGLMAALLLTAGAAAAAEPAPPAPGAIRVAVFNVALSREEPGALVQELRLGGAAQIDAVAEIVQRVRPDILLLLELDRDDGGESLRLMQATLREGRGGAAGIDYPHGFAEPSNTGVLATRDLDGDGAISRPADAYGYGLHEGHYAMALLSRFPLGPARSFATLRWADMPEALLPRDHYGAAADVLRLSSKSHWDVAVDTPDGRLRVLASHPTPPVFDGPEDRNGRRNADEIRFWADYLSGAGWMTDDAGARGGDPGGPFVLLGDLNADPADGDGRREAIRALLAHPALVDPAPRSAGGAAAADAGHDGDPALDTARFGGRGGPGALRVDYALPSADLDVAGAGGFWPGPGEPLRRLVGDRRPVSSDHRLVWVDVRLP